MPVQVEINPLAEHSKADNHHEPTAGTEEHIPPREPTGTKAQQITVSLIDCNSSAALPLDTAPCVQVREVCKHRLSAHFTHQGRVESIWGDSDFHLYVQQLLGTRRVLITSKTLSVLFMANTLFEVIVELTSA